ncbi:MAG TPA: SMP-30/gluconolactonase/LRE family protein [Vicinamibacterales bacterium]|jgi:sugar lactone lactonase YvrE
MPKPPSISPADLTPFGTGLHRPECVVVGRDGSVYVPDWRGGVTRIAADGSQRTWLADKPPVELRPNGIDLMPDGSFLIANLADAGGVWRLHRDGTLEPFLTEIDGRPLPPANFVVRDGDRTWISVSTWQVPRQQAWRPGAADGFIVLVDRNGARIAADGLHYTNEVRPDPSGSFLYVVETFGRRLLRLRIAANGDLSASETVASLGHGCFPDGFAFDRTGRIWITSLISNRLLCLDHGEIATVLEDVNAEFVAEVEHAFANGAIQKEHLGPISGTRLQQLTSVAFGSSSKNLYLGSLHADCVYRVSV